MNTEELDELSARFNALEFQWTTGPTPPDPVNHPKHYTSHPSGIEPIEICAYETFYRGNVIKYVMRAPYKGCELQDLKKARQYLDWEINRVEDADE